MKQRVLSSSFNLDIIFNIIGIILSFLMIYLGGFGSGNVVYLLVGVLILTTCLIWLVIRKKELLIFHRTISDSWFKFFAAGFLVLYITSIIAIYLRPNFYERPILYFVLTAFMAGTIALESFVTGRRHVGFVLVQILLLGTSLAWSQMLIFPGMNGVDAWYHLNLIQNILFGKEIPNGYDYSKLPIVHLLVGITSLITGLPVKPSIVLTSSLGQIVGNVIFIFLISNTLFKNHTIGLLSALLVVIAEHHIQFSYLLYPNAFCMVFVVIVLYLMFNMIRDRHQLPFCALFMVLTAAIIFTHSITAAFMAILLFLFWGAITFYSRLYQQAIFYFGLLIPITFAVEMFAWWTYVSMHTSRLGSLISINFNPDLLIKSTFDLSHTNINRGFVDIIFSALPFFLFIVTSFIGVFYMVSRKGNSFTFTYALLSISPLLISFIFFISGKTVVTERWFYFAQVLLSIPLSLTIYWLGALGVKRSIYKCLIFFMLIVAFSSLMITSTIGNHDNFSFPHNNKLKIYHTNSELEGYEFFVNKSTKTLSIDGGSIPVLKYYYNTKNYKRIDSAYTTGNFDHDGNPKLLRRDMILCLQRIGVLSSNINPDIYIYMSYLGFNKIYNNQGLVGYI